MPTRYPKEFRDDVIAVARRGDQSIAKVARSFGISESCLARWLRIADREDGRGAGSPATTSGGDLERENRELRKRTKTLEQENEILRRATAYFARDVLPRWCSRWSLISPPTASLSR
jgi:transposase